VKVLWLAIAWNGFKQLLPWMMCEENSRAKTPSSWRKMIAMSSQCGIDVALSKARFGPLEVFDRF
jgi:hypothetical protein